MLVLMLIATVVSIVLLLSFEMVIASKLGIWLSWIKNYTMSYTDKAFCVCNFLAQT